MSPYFTWWRKQVIRHDLTNANEYLNGLNLSMPNGMPPLGIQTGASNCGSVTPRELPLYRSEIVIGQFSVRSRQIVTLCYIQYLVQTMIPLSDGDNQIIEGLTLDVIFSSYLSYSFWNKRPPLAPGYDFTQVFWRLRQCLGKDFTDHLVAATLKAAADNPAEGRNQNLALYFAAKVKIGESIVDNECSQWPQIEMALLQLGSLDRDKLQHQDLTGSHVSTVCSVAWGSH